MEVQKIPEMRTRFNYHTMNHVVLLCVVSSLTVAISSTSILFSKTTVPRSVAVAINLLYFSIHMMHAPGYLSLIHST